MRTKPQKPSFTFKAIPHMDTLNKTIKKLSDDEYQQLVAEVSGNRKNKPFIVLETTRHRDVDDSEMMDILQVNPNAYYTLKSRLNSKIAGILSKKVENPIQGLLNEVSRVPAHLFGGNRDFSIRALRELEKQLIEYDLNAELIHVYKTLAQLNLHTEDYEFYNKKYQRHVAYSLAVTKAEAIFFNYLKDLGAYQLTGENEAWLRLTVMEQELENISELYDSHRLYVIRNIVGLYSMFNASGADDGLLAKAVEVDNVLMRMNAIFEKYPLDTFYQNLKCAADILHFEYHVRTGQLARAEQSMQRIHHLLPVLLDKHILNFFVVQFLRGKMMKYRQDGVLNDLAWGVEMYSTQLDPDSCESAHVVAVSRYLALVRFYGGDYSGAARKINELRNKLPLKQFLFADLDSKIFQALQYCILGDDGLCQQVLSSIKRQIKDREEEFASIRPAMKLIKTALKPADYRKKVKRIAEMWNDYQFEYKAAFDVLGQLRIDEAVVRKMSNPIKSDM